jgi:hypothetical protein
MELTLDSILGIVTIIASLIAAVASLLNLNQAKRAIFSDVITKNRLKWIDDLRSASYDFLKSYSLELNNQNMQQFEASYFKLLLLFNSSREEYRDLESILLKYADTFDKVKIVDHTELIKQIRFIAANSYIRAKDESGSIPYDEVKHNKYVKKNIV